MCEWADGGSNLDVQINGESIVQDGVAEIPYSNQYKPGVIKTVDYPFWGSGVGKNSSGTLTLFPATTSMVDERNRQNVSPISVNNLDYAVKAAMCDGKGATWTADEQTAARERMGIGDWELIADLTLEEEARNILVNNDINGNSLSLNSVKIFVFSPVPRESSKHNGYLRINGDANYYGVIYWKVNEKESLATVHADVFGKSAPAEVRFSNAIPIAVAASTNMCFTPGKEIAYYDAINSLTFIANYYFDKKTRFVVIGKA